MSNSKFKKGMVSNRVYAEVSRIVVRKDTKGKVIGRTIYYNIYEDK